MISRIVALASLVAAGCAPAPSPSGGPDVASVALPEPPPTASASGSAAPEATGPARFVPDLPAAGLPPLRLAGTQPCKIADHLLGPADDVVREKGILHPAALAFGSNGGLAAWLHGGRVKVRPLHRSGRPYGPPVSVPGIDLPTIVPLGDGFVLGSIKDRTVSFVNVLPGGEATGTARSDLKLEPSGLVGAFAQAGRAVLVFTEKGGMPTGVGSRLGAVEVEFASAGSRTSMRVFDIGRPLAADSLVHPGRFAGERAMLLEGPSGARTAISERGIVDSPEIDFASLAHLDVQEIGGKNPSGFPFSVTPRERFPRLRAEADLPPSEAARFTLVDADWTGLGEIVWTGERLAVARLSGPKGQVEARLFAVDCAPP